MRRDLGVRTQDDERLWEMAKERAAAQGRPKDWPYVMGIFQHMKQRTGSRPVENPDLTQLEVELSPEELQAFEDMIHQRYYSIADFADVGPAEARLAIAFREAMRQTEGEYGWRAVKAVPSRHMTGRKERPQRLMLIYEDVRNAAEEEQFSDRWMETQDRIGAWMEMYNSASATIWPGTPESETFAGIENPSEDEEDQDEDEEAIERGAERAAWQAAHEEGRTLDNPSEVQSLLIPIDLMSLAQAKRWAKDHGYLVGRLDESERYYRFRQFDPSKRHGYRTIPFGDEGIMAVIQVPKRRKNPGNAVKLSPGALSALEVYVLDPVHLDDAPFDDEGAAATSRDILGSMVSGKLMAPSADEPQRCWAWHSRLSYAAESAAESGDYPAAKALNALAGKCIDPLR